MQPFVRWVGGKRKHVSELMRNMPNNYKVYYEPFVGGGALFLAVAPKRSVINDVNVGLMAMWRSLQEDPQQLVGVVSEMFDEYNALNAKKQRAMFEQVKAMYNAEKQVGGKNNDVTLAALFCFLTFTSYNATYRENGKGDYNNGFAKFPHVGPLDADNLWDISDFLGSNKSKIKILCENWSDAIQSAKAGDFIYFDPPYYSTKGGREFQGYNQHAFDAKEHARLAETCRLLDRKGVNWMVSNNDDPFIRKLFKGYPMIRLHNQQSNGGKGDRYGRRTNKMDLLIRNY